MMAETMSNEEGALAKMRGLCFGGLLPLRLHRLAGFEQTPLGDVELIVGGALFYFDAADRRAGFMLPRLLRTQLFVRGAPFGGDRHDATGTVDQPDPRFAPSAVLAAWSRGAEGRDIALVQ